MFNKLALLLLAFFATTWSHASDIVTITYGFGHGPGDTIIRTLAIDAENQSPVKFRVENKPGAGGLIALREYYKLPASDGKLLGISGGQTVVDPAQNPENNFLPRMRVIGPVITFPLALAVNADGEFSTIDDLFDRKKPRRTVNIATGGPLHEILVTLIAKHSHHDVQAIRFKGGAEQAGALRGRHVDAEVNSYGSFLPRDNVKILAVTRAQALPNAPSILKWVPEANIVNFFGIAINKEVSDTKHLERVLTAGFVDNKRQDFWLAQGYTVDLNPKADFVERVMIPDLQRWQKIFSTNKQ
jgi:tripartite-type tricarboxylate transporter receptor subunit TctC